MPNDFDTSAYPLGSMHPYVLYNNAGNEDLFANDMVNETWVDRPPFNRVRKTIYGMEKDFNRLLAASGFELPAIPYAGSVVINRPSQMISYLGNLYSVKADASFPYTLNGTFSVDEPNLVLRTDTALRIDLANIVDPRKGAALVGNGVVYVGSYADMRNLDKTMPAKVANFDGFIYRLDESDITSDETIPRIVLATDGGRWKCKWKRGFDITQYLETPTSDISEAINRGLAQGGSLLAPDGLYTLTTTIGYALAGLDFPDAGTPSKRVTFKGESLGNTIFEYLPVSPSSFALVFGGTIGSGSLGGFTFSETGTFTVVHKNRSYPLPGRTGGGVKHTAAGYSHVRDLAVQYFDTGLQIDGCLSNEYSNLYLRDNKIGLYVTRSAATLPNAISFNKLILTGNSVAGAYFEDCGAGNCIKGGSVEGNGTQGNLGTSGITIAGSGDNGIAIMSIEDQYFENNAGAADLTLINKGNTPIVYRISNTQFHRLQDSLYTEANIDLRTLGAGSLTLILEGNGFLSGTEYTPSPTRPFIKLGANCFVQGLETCVMNETVSLGGTSVNSMSRALCGSVSCPIGGPITILNAPFNTIVTRINPGEYSVQYVDGYAPSVEAYTANVIPTGLVAGVRLAYLKKTAADTFQFAFNGPTPTGPYQDSDFSFTVFEHQ